MDDLFKNPNDIFEIDPPTLGPAFTDALVMSLTKKLSNEYQKPWTQAQESELQEKISALVAEANAHGLRSFQLIVTRPTGEKVSRKMDVQLINSSRSLQ